MVSVFRPSWLKFGHSPTEKSEEPSIEFSHGGEIKLGTRLPLDSSQDSYQHGDVSLVKRSSDLAPKDCYYPSKLGGDEVWVTEDAYRGYAVDKFGVVKEVFRLEDYHYDN